MNEVRERFGDDYAMGFAFDLLDNAFEKSEKQKKKKKKKKSLNVIASAFQTF